MTKYPYLTIRRVVTEIENGERLTHVARKHGIPISTVWGWKVEFSNGKRMELELKALREENRVMKTMLELARVLTEENGLNLQENETVRSVLGAFLSGKDLHGPKKLSA